MRVLPPPAGVILSLLTEVVCLGPLGGVSVQSVAGLFRAPQSSALNEAILAVPADLLW